MKFCAAILAAAVLPFAAAGSNPTFAGDYLANSDVTEHGEVDLDVKSILDAIGTGNVVGAKAVYTTGENSEKSGGIKRTLQGFSTGMKIKGIKVTYTGEEEKSTIASSYYEMAYSLTVASGLAEDYADTLVVNALDADTPSQEVVSAAINFGNTLMYTMHELYDAINDAKSGSVDDNDGGAKAWDEGAAFWAGSEAVKGAPSLYSLYGKIEALSLMFGETDEADNKIAPINDKIMTLMKSGRDKIDDYTSTGKADITDAQETELLNIAEQIHGLFTAATIQYFIYAHHSALSAYEKTALNEILATVIYPELNACTKDGAKTFKANTLDAVDYDAVTSGWAATMETLQENYHCMINTLVDDKYHMGCSIVGAYDDGNGKTEAACDDAKVYPYTDVTATVSGTADVTVSQPVAGYTPASDVAKHSLLDKDVRRISLLAGSGDFDNAYRIYANGWNSWKTNDDGTFKSFRNYKAFASSSKLALFQEGRDLNDYFGNYQGHDDAITAALQGTTPWSTNPSLDEGDLTARKEMAVKTLQFGINLYYVIREMYDAVDDCEADNLTDNFGYVHAWDEAVAFWAGSLEGPEAGGSSDGELLHMLAEKRSGNYQYTNAVHGKTSSSVNSDILAQYKLGEGHLTDGECPNALPVIEKLISLSIVPVIQGAQRYAWKVASGTANTPKSRAEGWAFTTSIIPMVKACDAASAATLEKNMDYFATTPMIDGIDAVYEAWQKTFECLGVTCNDIGEFVESTSSPVTTGIPICKDDFSSDMDGASARTAARVGAGALAAVAGGLAAMAL